MAVDKKRLDQLLVERGLAESRERAQRVIRAGQVRSGDRILAKPGVQVAVDILLEVSGLGEKYVGRGGLKLEAAFEAFPELTPCPPVCADIGASTGGFTDCMLQRGARRVYAIDVGRGLLHERLRRDPRVVVMDRVNARYLTPDMIPEPIDLATCDVSFISLRVVLEPIARLLRPETGQVVALVKPQFEAGRERVGKGGVVRDPAVHRDVLRSIVFEVAPAAGLQPKGLAASPVKGPAGNIEHLLWMTNSPEDASEGAVTEEAIARVVEAAFSKAGK